MTVLAAIDWDALLEVIWSSLAATLGVALAANTAIIGGARFVEARRAADPFGQVAYGVVATAGMLAIGAAVVLGILVMTEK